MLDTQFDDTTLSSSCVIGRTSTIDDCGHLITDLDTVFEDAINLSVDSEDIALLQALEALGWRNEVVATDDVDYFYIEAKSNNVEVTFGAFISDNNYTMEHFDPYWEDDAPILFYSFDKVNWIEYTLNTTITLKAKARIYFKGNSSEGKWYFFDSTNNVEARVGFSIIGFCYSGGNVMTLRNANGSTHLDVVSHAFAGLFKNCAGLLTAPKLCGNSVGPYYYEQTFLGCASLAEAPELPATIISEGCYKLMFSNCIALTKAPELPATELAPCCYQEMFAGCSSLTEPPQLPATALSRSCYYGMFKNYCPLRIIPKLNIKGVVPVYACTDMFRDSVFASSTSSSPSIYAYRVPTEGEVQIADILGNMFTEFTPSVNTTFYVSVPSL